MTISRHVSIDEAHRLNAPWAAPERQGGDRRGADDGGAMARRLQADTIAQFMKREIPTQELLLAPWLARKSLSLLHSWRGTGKTWIALAISYAVASGGSFLGWRAAAPRRVLHVDGEMPAGTLQKRLAAIIKGSDREPPEENFQIIAADLTGGGMPDFASAEGQAALDEQLEGIDLVVLDNLSTLCRSIRENEADDWLAVQDWLLRLRREGRSVLIFHHSGKTRTQRGTSRREDILDCVIALRRPADYTPQQGARFEIHFEKARNLHGQDARPLEVTLNLCEDAARWTVNDIAQSMTDRIVTLTADGATQRKIASELGVAVSTVNRRLGKSRRKEKEERE